MTGNPRIKVGSVTEKDSSTISADIVTTGKEALVQRLCSRSHYPHFTIRFSNLMVERTLPREDGLWLGLDAVPRHFPLLLLVSVPKGKKSRDEYLQKMRDLESYAQADVSASDGAWGTECANRS